jgi:hypothetical protein
LGERCHPRCLRSRLRRILFQRVERGSAISRSRSIPFVTIIGSSDGRDLQADPARCSGVFLFRASRERDKRGLQLIRSKSPFFRKLNNSQIIPICFLHPVCDIV